MNTRAATAAHLRAEAACLDAEAAVGHARAARLWTIRQAGMARTLERRALGRAEDSMRLKLRAAELEARHELHRAVMDMDAFGPREVLAALATSRTNWLDAPSTKAERNSRS
jgi:hypothetical protein